MKKLIIVSEKTRGHFQSGVNLFCSLNIIHFYKSTFTDMVIDENDHKFVRYHNVFDLYKKLKAEKPDLIQPLEPYYGYSRLRLPFKVLPIILATYLFCKKYKVPYFIHFLENLRPRQKYGWPFYLIMQSIARMLVRRARLLYFVNQGAKRNIELLGGQSKARYGLWGIWGVDRELYKPVRNFDKNLILFVGRITEQKGVFDLIDMFEIVQKDVPSSTLKIVGNGEAMDQLRRKIKEKNLESKVILEGEIPDRDIAKYYQQSSVLVVPSKTLRYSAEQVGMVIIEAMACGKPVVAYDAGSISEFVKDGQTGAVVNESDKGEMAKKVIELLKDSGLRERMAKKATREVEDRFDQKKNVKKLEEEVLSLVSC